MTDRAIPDPREGGRADAVGPDDVRAHTVDPRVTLR